MKQIVAGHQIGKALCEALGLPKLTRSFELRCAVDEAVTVKCEYYPEVDAMQLEAALAEFEVYRRDKPVKVDFDAWLRAEKDAAHAAMLARHATLSRMDQQMLAFNGLMRWAHA